MVAIIFALSVFIAWTSIALAYAGIRLWWAFKDWRDAGYTEDDDA
jgi:hypothetical protein